MNMIFDKQANPCKRLKRIGPGKEIFLAISALLLSGSVWATDVNIVDYGARNDAKTVNTVPIQRAIDACASTGGGKVTIPAGTFLSGTIYLKSHVNLCIEEGATLKGSDQIADYGAVKGTPALIIAHDVTYVSVSGPGVIDGNGHAANFQKGDNAHGRPMLMFFVDCRHVAIRAIHLQAPAFWTQKYSGCDGVLVTGISVYAHGNWNNDGIDIDSRNVVVSNCTFDTDDDAICLKSERDAPCENVTITNCIAASNCNGIKMGTASRAGFRNINISNITIHAASEDNIRHWKKTLTGITSDRTVLSGIAIEDVDGGHTDQINVSHITMTSVQTPIFIRLGDRRQPAGSLSHIMISDIIATSESQMCSIIAGIPGVPVRGVRIHNVMIVSHAGSKAGWSLDSVPENTRGYPENRMFGNTLPAGGFFIRHAEDVQLDNIRVEAASDEQRPFLVADDVQGLSVRESGYNPTATQHFAALYQLRNLRQAAITPEIFRPASWQLLRIEGAASRDIRLYLDKRIPAGRLASAGPELKLGSTLEVFSKTNK